VLSASASGRSLRLTCGAPGCRNTHNLPGGTRCAECRRRAARHLAAGWAIVHYPDHDERVRVVDVKRRSVAILFGEGDEAAIFVRGGGGLLWRQVGVDGPTVHLTMGSGRECD